MKMTKIVLRDTFSTMYLTDILGEKFTKCIGEAKDISWMWLFRYLYLFTMNKAFPKRNFKMVCGTRSKVNFEIDLLQK